MDTRLYQNYFSSFGAPIYRRGGKSRSNKKKKKSGIHINPKNEGKFSEQAARAGMGVQEYASHVLANKENYDGLTVRRANFARNAKKWKHARGGVLSRYLDIGGSTPSDSEMAYLQAFYDRVHPDISYMSAAQNEEETQNPESLSPSQSFATSVDTPSQSAQPSAGVQGRSAGNAAQKRQRSLYSLDRQGRKDFRKTGQLFYDKDGDYNIYRQYTKPESRAMSREAGRFQRAENRFENRLAKGKTAKWNSGRFSDEANAMHDERKKDWYAQDARKRYFSLDTDATPDIDFDDTASKAVISGSSNDKGKKSENSQSQFKLSGTIAGSQSTAQPQQQTQTQTQTANSAASDLSSMLASYTGSNAPVAGAGSDGAQEGMSAAAAYRSYQAEQMARQQMQNNTMNSYFAAMGSAPLFTPSFTPYPAAGQTAPQLAQFPYKLF